MRNVISILFWLLVLSASTAKADDPSKQFGGNFRTILDTYDKAIVSKDRQQIGNLIDGITIGFRWANAMLNTRNQPPLYCQPEKLPLDYTKVIEMMRRAMKDNPKWGDFDLGMMVLVTLQRSFPC
jgi:hypothetical protein